MVAVAVVERAVDPAAARRDAVRELGVVTARLGMLRHDLAKQRDPLGKRAVELLVAIAACSDRVDELLDTVLVNS